MILSVHNRTRDPRAVFMRTIRSRAAAAAAVLVAACCAQFAFGRDLAAIDRLGDAAPDAAYAARRQSGIADPTMALHSRLGVPTFVWGQRGGAPSEMANAARVRPGTPPEPAARAYLRALGALYALPSDRTSQVPVQHVQMLSNGGALVKFRNRVGGVDVFREEASVLLGPERDLIAIGGFLMGGNGAGGFTGGPEAAITRALAEWSFAPDVESQLRQVGTRGDYQTFDLPDGTLAADGSRLDAPVRVRKVWFRLPGMLRAAWYVETMVRDATAAASLDAYAWVIADDDRTVLFRKNLSAHAAFSYRTYAEAGNLPLPSPLGRNGFPYPNATPNGFQGAFVAQNLVTLQNLAFSRNDPWLAPGATQTTGNNVDAYADIVGPDGFSLGDFRASVTSPGVFDYPYDTGQAPDASATQRKASIVNLFYMTNWLHDWYYDAGFDEAAGNAQASNFGRGGLENDVLLAEAQDFSGRDNSNMITPSDGASPRMQMFIFDGLVAAGATINSPAAIAGAKVTGPAQFGMAPPFTVTANVGLASPSLACGPIGDLTGRIALIDRGTCSFELKTLNAQNAHAVGVIVTDNVAEPVLGMPDDPSIAPGVVTIPAVSISQADGNAVKTQLLSTTVNATLLASVGVDRDGTLDNTIVAHEWGHYISNRLIGDANGLAGQQAGGLGEGFGDFHALLLLVKDGDAALPNNANFNGAYPVSGYVSGGPAAPPSDGLYYGIRRYPYSRDMTKNPLTFKHIATSSVLPASPPPNLASVSPDNAEVHNAGEVWTSMLWECYGNLLNDTARLTFAQAQDRMKRYLVLGYKMMPASPTFVEARDAILAGMLAQDAQDYALCLKGFTKRGLGINAIAPDRFDPNNTGPVESFVEGGAIAIASVDLTDAPSTCDSDGYLDNGETGSIVVKLRNFGLTPLSATTGAVSSGNAKVTFPGGSALPIPQTTPGQLATVTLPAHLAGAAGIELASLTVTVDDPGLMIARPVTSAGNPFWVNVDEAPTGSKSDGFETRTDVWTTLSSLASPVAGEIWQRIAVPGVGHRWLGPDPSLPQLAALASPLLNVSPSANFSFTFSHRHLFEFDILGDFDGGRLLLSNDGGQTFFDIGSAATPTYNGTLAVYQGNQNPFAGLPAYTRGNVGYPAFETVTVNLGTAFAGQTVFIAFVIGTDNVGGAPGWEIDDISFSGITNSPFPLLSPQANSCFSLSVQAGAPQFAPIGTQFPVTLRALVKDAQGTPAPGVSVTFTPPASGASASFSGSSTVQSDGTGIAVAPALTANATIGHYAVSASIGSQSIPFPLVNTSSKPLDMDANNAYDPLTDGLLVLRHLFGLSGPQLTANALGSGATRNTDTAIAQYATDIVPVFDVDGNGTEDPFTDGVMIMRYLFGFRGAALTQDVLGAGATRNTAQIEAYIASLTP